MQLRTTEVENGTRIEVVGDGKAAVIIQENGDERILIPLENKEAETTYYYEDSSGLAKTSQGYIGFYNGSPDNIELIN